MQFCILYCELKGSDTFEDSFNYFCVRYNNTNNLIKDTIKTSDTDICKEEFISFLSSMNCSINIYTLHSYDSIKDCLTSIKNLNLSLNLLSSALDLPQSWGLYEIFSYYFDSNNKVLSDLDMLDVIVTSVLTARTQIQYSFCVYFYNDNKYSFSWFYIDNASNLRVLGDDCLILTKNQSEGYILGKFIKCLRYKMAKTGCCVARTKFLTWSETCVNENISNYILGFKTLRPLFNSISGLDFVDYNSVIRLLSNDLKYSYEVTAKEFVTALSQSSKALGLSTSEDGTLVCKNVFKKDYSICISSLIDKSRCKWGIILDCEGNKGNKAGLRELGGIIFCRYNNIMLSVETFECTEVLLEETLKQTIKNYESNTGRYIPTRGIDIYTYGGVDAYMIEDSLKSVGTKQFRKRLSKVFKYHDCREYIYAYIEDNNISCEEKKTLSNIARILGVQVVHPKHSALADSRTLFNVLAFILQETDKWFPD